MKTFTGTLHVRVKARAKSVARFKRMCADVMSKTATLHVAGWELDEVGGHPGGS